MALAAAKQEPSSMQALENLPKVKPMLLQVRGQVHHQGRWCRRTFLCKSLERAGHTTKPKWYVSEFVQAHSGSRGGSDLGSITWMNQELPVPTLQVYSRIYWSLPVNLGPHPVEGVGRHLSPSTCSVPCGPHKAKPPPISSEQILQVPSMGWNFLR